MCAVAQIPTMVSAMAAMICHSVIIIDPMQKAAPRKQKLMAQQAPAYIRFLVETFRLKTCILLKMQNAPMADVMMVVKSMTCNAISSNISSSQSRTVRVLPVKMFNMIHSLLASGNNNSHTNSC